MIKRILGLSEIALHPISSARKSLQRLPASHTMTTISLWQKQTESPLLPDRLSAQFPQFLMRNDMPYIRFHDLRHTAATNMHELTGDFYTVGEILGHTLNGVNTALGISPNMPDVTARYVEVRAPRKSIVLEAYHNAVFPREAERLAAKMSKGRDAVR